MDSFISHLSETIKNIRFFKILIIIIITLVFLVFVSQYIFRKGGKKSKATGETVTITFTPSSLDGEATADLTPLKIMGKPTIDIRARGYEIILTFDKTHLKVKDITYPSACPSVSGYSTTAEQANDSGSMRIACANTSTEGFILSSSSDTEIAKVTFESKKAASSNISIDPNSVQFSIITSDGLLTIPSSSNSLITASVVTGNSPTNSVTISPATPTTTTAPNQPTNTPTPTETPTQPAVSLSLNLKLKFQGILAKPSNGLNKIGVTVTVAKDNNKETLNNIIFTANESGIWTSNAPMLFSQIPPGTGYYILVKGGKHLQKKICDNNPSESYPGTYHCDQGKITLSPGDNTLDFSKIVLLAGDLPQQDGIVNSYDTSLVRNNLGKTDTHAISLADINLDGVVDTQDYSLIIAALSIRTDEGESTETRVNLPTTVSPTLITTAPTTQPSLTVTPSGSGGGSSGAGGDLLRDGSTYPVYVSISFMSCNQVTSPVSSITLSLLDQSKSYNNVPLTYETLKITRPLLIGEVNINDFLAQDLHTNDTEVYFGPNTNLKVQATGINDYFQNLNDAYFQQMEWCTDLNGCLGVSYPELQNQRFIYIDQIRVCY